MKSNKQWFAVHVRTGTETKMAEYLKKKGFESYCPQVKTEQLWLGKSKMLLAPLFKTFVFVRLAQDELAFIKQMNGIIGFMYWIGKPVTVKDNEIYNLQLFINEYPFLKLEKVAISENEPTKVISRSLLSKEGNLQGIKSCEVSLYLPSLGYQLVAELEENISIIETAGKEKYKAVI